LTVCGIVCVYLLELSTSAVVVDPLFSTIRHPLLQFSRYFPPSGIHVPSSVFESHVFFVVCVCVVDVDGGY